MKTPKTAQELMEEINRLKKVLEEMDRVPEVLEEQFHILSACEGEWSYHRCCEDRKPAFDGGFNESWTCEFLDNRRLFALYDKLLDICDDNKRKVNKKIQKLHDKRNGLTAPRNPGLGKLGSIESTFGHTKETLHD